MARHADITQNNKYAIYMQYVKKEVSDKIYFWQVHKHKGSLQSDTTIFDGDDQTFPKFPKYQVSNVFTTSPKTS